jgi:hypothetical protein
VGQFSVAEVGQFYIATNNSYVRDVINDHITLLSSSESITPAEALPKAVEYFKNTHTFLTDYGLSNEGVWVDTRGRGLPEGFEHSWSATKQKITEELEGSLYEDHNGYFIQPNPLSLTDRDWQVYGRSSGLPIVNMKVNIDKMQADNILKIRRGIKAKVLGEFEKRNDPNEQALKKMNAL